MTAYAIFIRETTTDPAELATYGEKVQAARAGHEMRALVRYGAFEVLEGDPVEGVVVLEFPTIAAARAWYDSPEYQAALVHRLAGAKYRVVVVEGA